MPLNQNISSLIKWLWVAEGINQQCRAAAHTTRTSCGLQIKFTRFSYYFDSKSFSLWRFVRCLRRFDTLNTKQKKTWHLAISRLATTREEEKNKIPEIPSIARHESAAQAIYSINLSSISSSTDRKLNHLFMTHKMNSRVFCVPTNDKHNKVDLEFAKFSAHSPARIREFIGSINVKRTEWNEQTPNIALTCKHVIFKVWNMSGLRNERQHDKSDFRRIRKANNSSWMCFWI